eukprot:symbB.v1.2.004329.t1/scaffold188.1/size279614/18
MRSKRLFHLLQQNFTGYRKIENLIKSQISALGITESNGFELLRLIRKEFSLLSRSEALGYREQCTRFRVKKSDHLPDIVRETVASSVALCEPQLEHAGSSLTEEFIEGRHFVCAIDEVNHEHVRGFPVEIDLEGPPNDDDEDSGYVPTPEHERDEAMPSDLGERKEVIPQEPESDFSEDFEEPQLLGSLLRQHEARGHWPYDKGCDSCVQARGRTPARRRRHEGGDDQSPALTSMAADFTFVAGKYWRILVILMIHTGMMGMVVITGNRENDIKSIASVLNEIGVGGLNIEVATDNEGYLKDLMAKGLTKSNMRSFHWRNISEYRPQAKGIERAVGIAKEGIYTNWLAFEEHCQCRIALESPLLGYLIGYVYRTFDIFCEQRQSGTPLEKMRGARGGQKPSSHPFGMIGFVKPVLLDPCKGHRMVLSVYLGMRYVTGGGVLAFLLNQDANGHREVIRGHSFRAQKGVQYDVNAVWPLLSGVKPNDPNVAPPFVDPREVLEGEPQVEEGVLDDMPAVPAPSRRESVPAEAEEVPAAGNLEEDETMDVDLRGDEDDDEMDLGMIERLPIALVLLLCGVGLPKAGSPVPPIEKATTPELTESPEMVAALAVELTTARTETEALVEAIKEVSSSVENVEGQEGASKLIKVMLLGLKAQRSISQGGCIEMKQIAVKQLDLLRHVASGFSDQTDLLQQISDDIGANLNKLAQSFVKLSDVTKDGHSRSKDGGTDIENRHRQLLEKLDSQNVYFLHIRNGVNGLVKELKNLQWTAEELRTGGKEGKSGEVSAKAGSLLATLNRNLAEILESYPVNLASMTDEITKSLKTLEGIMKEGLEKKRPAEGPPPVEPKRVKFQHPGTKEGTEMERDQKMAQWWG